MIMWDVQKYLEALRLMPPTLRRTARSDDYACVWVCYTLYRSIVACFPLRRSPIIQCLLQGSKSDPKGSSKLCNHLGQCRLPLLKSPKACKRVPKWSQNRRIWAFGRGALGIFRGAFGILRGAFGILVKIPKAPRPELVLEPFWDPLWDQFGVILGIIFLMFF